MIYPLTTDPANVNSAMIRIADENNADIDYMQDQIKNMRGQQQEIEDRLESQKTRWANYQKTYQALLAQFQIQSGAIKVEQIYEFFPWAKN